jgi:hypothetical protein
MSYTLFTLSTPSFADHCDLAGICPACGDSVTVCECDAEDALLASADLDHDSERALELAASWAESVIALVAADPSHRGWALSCAETLEVEGYHILGQMVRAAL